jgi:hypothetical protein
MTKAERQDEILKRDWGADWDILPEAPPLVDRRKTAQITLRMPRHVLIALKSVAEVKSLPYHGLARSWIIDGLRSQQLPDAEVEVADEELAAAEQLNLKLEPRVLDGLKAFSDRVRRPYHRLARHWIEAALAREHAAFARQPSSSSIHPAMRELMVLLLHAPGPSGGAAIHGVTRLQKLLFVMQQNLVPDASQFYGFNYGPFDERVPDTAEALRVRGFLKGSQPSATPQAQPSFEDMMATVIERAGPREGELPLFELNEAGHLAAERLRRSSEAYEDIFSRIRELRREWDTPDLVDRVYEAFPAFTDRSRIKDQVAQRRARRREK